MTSNTSAAVSPTLPARSDTNSTTSRPCTAPNDCRLREGKARVIKTQLGRLFILLAPCDRQDCLLVSICPLTGQVLWQNTEGEGIFPDVSLADASLVSILASQGVDKVVDRIDGDAVLGIANTGVSVAILLATYCKRNNIPGGTIVQVQGSKWIIGSLLRVNSESEVKSSSKLLGSLQDFSVDSMHFFGEGIDLSRVWAKRANWHEPVHEFRWNHSLHEPFKEAGNEVARCIPVLHQGVCTSSLHVVNGTQILMMMIARKSIHFPGTRYVARGLSPAPDCKAGNEVEAELVVWKLGSFESHAGEFSSSLKLPASAVTDWRSFFWRRGSVPVHWRTELKTSVSEPTIVIEDNSKGGTEAYFKYMLGAMQLDDCVCINLLRCESEQGEFPLSEAFQSGVRDARQNLGAEIQIRNFDWHKYTKLLGLDGTISGLWVQVSPFLQKWGMNGPNACQSGFFRFNCADSLDRTNVASFFVMLQVLHEALSQLCPALHEDSDHSNTSMPDILAQDCSAGNDWNGLKLNCDELKGQLPTGPLEEIAEAFMTCGDVFSLLYTNTPALHSSPMRAFSSKAAAAPNNHYLTLIRRVNNLFTDTAKTRSFETFLGKGMETIRLTQPTPHTLHLEGPTPNLVDATASPAFICRMPPMTHESKMLLPGILRAPIISHPEAEVLEIPIILKTICLPTRLVLELFPIDSQLCMFMEVRIGPSCSQMQRVLSKFKLPLVLSRTIVEIPLDMPGQNSPCSLPTLDCWSASSLTRVINVQFQCPPSQRGIPLPNISVLAYPIVGEGESALLLPDAKALDEQPKSSTQQLWDKINSYYSQKNKSTSIDSLGDSHSADSPKASDDSVKELDDSECFDPLLNPGNIDQPLEKSNLHNSESSPFNFTSGTELDNPMLLPGVGQGSISILQSKARKLATLSDSMDNRKLKAAIEFEISRLKLRVGLPLKTEILTSCDCPLEYGDLSGLVQWLRRPAAPPAPDLDLELRQYMQELLNELQKWHDEVLNEFSRHACSRKLQENKQSTSGHSCLVTYKNACIIDHTYSERLFDIPSAQLLFGVCSLNVHDYPAGAPFIVDVNTGAFSVCFSLDEYSSVREINVLGCGQFELDSVLFGNSLNNMLPTKAEDMICTSKSSSICPEQQNSEDDILIVDDAALQRQHLNVQFSSSARTSGDLNCRLVRLSFRSKNLALITNIRVYGQPVASSRLLLAHSSNIEHYFKTLSKPQASIRLSPQQPPSPSPAVSEAVFAGLSDVSGMSLHYPSKAVTAPLPPWQIILSPMGPSKREAQGLSLPYCNPNTTLYWDMPMGSSVSSIRVEASTPHAGASPIAAVPKPQFFTVMNFSSK